MLKKFVVFGTLVILTSCTPSGPLGPMPVVADQANAGSIEIMRVNRVVGAANSYLIALDGREIISIRTGQHVAFRADPGEHSITVKCFGGWFPTWKEDTTKFIILGPDVRYFKIEPNPWCASITSISRDYASELKKTSEKVSLSPK